MASGGVWKVSLHESGDWRFAFTRDFSLPDGRTACVTVFEYAMPAEERQQIEAARRALVEGMKQAGPEAQAVYEAMQEPRGYLYGHDEKAFGWGVGDFSDSLSTHSGE